MSDFVSTRPATRLEPRWFQTFSTQLAQTQTLAAFGGNVDLLLLGDSITDACAWMGEFQSQIQGARVLYYGIGGDQTQHVLWRIGNGILDGIRPRFVTLLIGINNFLPDTPAEEVAAGAIACGHAIRHKLPDATLLHFGVFSVGAHILHLNSKVDQINQQIQAATPSYRAQYVSMRDTFLTPDGKEIPGMLTADGVHLNGKAYDLWAKRIKDLTKLPA